VVPNCRRLTRAVVACLLLVLTVSGAAFPPVTPDPDDRRELVVLVHGMGRTRVSMFAMGWSLERAGFRVVNWGYSSTRGSVPELGGRLAREVRLQRGEAPRVHFVTHSLGGVLVRWALAHDPPERVGRVVMMAPPNQGSAAADRYTRWVGWLLPAIRELRTDPLATARALPLPYDVEVGVIAGARDGKVSIHESHLEGERDHAVVPAFHTFIMNRGDVQRLVRTFLREGTFGEAARAH
jgi:pimeloyl-ACP methyl ester carboxylesterase